MQRLRGASEAARVGDGEEVFEVAQFHDAIITLHADREQYESLDLWPPRGDSKCVQTG
ncbi:hypothetical protein GCM10010384_25730 [Streptomyces djakartensis]|uniref:Uncharacterized protein n=1 Tax=Streptomyces djakartensis TaxID=68193 RepID=A0ABQ2ZMT5_9ACTN|nr:hypothetical protein GCM10010384_25730 [Streptomyces djakartensis]